MEEDLPSTHLLNHHDPPDWELKKLKTESRTAVFNTRQSSSYLSKNGRNNDSSKTIIILFMLFNKKISRKKISLPIFIA